MHHWILDNRLDLTELCNQHAWNLARATSALLRSSRSRPLSPQEAHHLLGFIAEERLFFCSGAPFLPHQLPEHLCHRLTLATCQLPFQPP